MVSGKPSQSKPDGFASSPKGRANASTGLGLSEYDLFHICGRCCFQGAGAKRLRGLGCFHPRLTPMRRATVSSSQPSGTLRVLPAMSSRRLAVMWLLTRATVTP